MNLKCSIKVIIVSNKTYFQIETLKLIFIGPFFSNCYHNIIFLLLCRENETIISTDDYRERTKSWYFLLNYFITKSKILQDLKKTSLFRGGHRKEAQTRTSSATGGRMRRYLSRDEQLEGLEHEKVTSPCNTPDKTFE